jgi:hypothetical protein
MNGGNKGVRGFPLSACSIQLQPPFECSQLTQISYSYRRLSRRQPSWEQRAWAMEEEYKKYTEGTRNERDHSKRLPTVASVLMC